MQTEQVKDAPKALTVDQAAERLGLSKDLLYDLIRRGELPAGRFGRRIIRISPDVIDAALRGELTLRRGE